MPARFSHVHINVSNLDQSLDFYGKKLGLEVHKIMDSMGSVKLEPGSLDLDQVTENKLTELEGDKQTTVAFSVQDLVGYYNELKERGIETIDRPTKRSWGSFNFYLKDPDGYSLEVEQQDQEDR